MTFSTGLTTQQGDGTRLVEVFEIDSEAKLIDTPDSPLKTDTKKVLVFIDHDTKTVYLWRGKGAGLFKKLMGTKVAAKLSHSYPKYRIRPISEGHEPSSFKELMAKKKK